MSPPRNRSGSAGTGPAMAALAKIVAERTDTMRFLRGNELVERGMVASILIERGRAQAVVRGSHTTPYSVDVASSAEGELPSESAQLRTACTCPDWGDPCKHGVAVVLALAERLDSDDEALARFIGQRSPSASDRPLSVTSLVSTTPLPTVPPIWAHDVVARSTPHDAAEYFGDDPIPVIVKRAVNVSTDEILEALGSMMVDDLDLAPDFGRLLRRLGN
jgi:hypothetical protein